VGGKVVGLGSFAYCFSLARLLEVTMFALFKCFSTFQQRKTRDGLSNMLMQRDFAEVCNGLLSQVLSSYFC
jgi:hypothetical protein